MGPSQALGLERRGQGLADLGDRGGDGRGDGPGDHLPTAAAAVATAPRRSPRRTSSSLRRQGSVLQLSHPGFLRRRLLAPVEGGLRLCESWSASSLPRPPALLRHRLLHSRPRNTPRWPWPRAAENRRWRAAPRPSSPVRCCRVSLLPARYAWRMRTPPTSSRSGSTRTRGCCTPSIPAGSRWTTCWFSATSRRCRSNTGPPAPGRSSRRHGNAPGRHPSPAT